MATEDPPATASRAALHGEELKALLKDSLREILREEPGLLSARRAGSTAGKEETPPGELGSERVSLGIVVMAVDHAMRATWSWDRYLGTA